MKNQIKSEKEEKINLIYIKLKNMNSQDIDKIFNNLYSKEFRKRYFLKNKLNNNDFYCTY